jgi:hypothetical protein
MTRWTISVNDTTDRDLRAFLGLRGGKKGDFSHFIEQAVNDRIARLTLQEVRAKNADVDIDTMMRDVGAAVEAVRAARY